MAEAVEAPPKGRPARCAIHHTAASVGRCDVCGRQLCIACATPVRGRLVGAECLPQVVQEVAPAATPAGPFRRRGDAVAALAFMAVLVLSILSWSRGAFVGLFGAWSENWSFLAVGAGLAGSILAVASWRRGRRPGVTALVYGVLGLLVGVGAVLHRIHPPVLSEPTWPSAVAVGAGGAAVVAAVLKWRDALRARRGLS